MFFRMHHLFEKNNLHLFLFFICLSQGILANTQVQSAIYFDIKGNKVESKYAASKVLFNLSSNGEIKGWAQHKTIKTPFTEEYLLRELLLTDTSGASFLDMKAIQLIWYDKGIMSSKFISTIAGGQSIRDLYKQLTGRFYEYEKSALKAYVVLNDGSPTAVYEYDNFGKINSIRDFTQRDKGYAEILYLQSSQRWEKRFEADFTEDVSDIPFTEPFDLSTSKLGAQIDVNPSTSYSAMFQSPMELLDLSTVMAELEFKGGSAFFGLIFGAQTGTGSGWKFCIDNQGFYEIMKLYNGQSVSLPLRRDRFEGVRNRMSANEYAEALQSGVGSSELIKKVGSNIISVRLYNGSIIFYINGIEVERLQSDIAGNYLGLVGDRNSEGAASCYLKRVSVSNTLFDFDPYSLAENIRVSSGSGSGTGFLINSQGGILTNYHVVQSAKNISVLINNKYHPCKLIGFDKEKDLALIRPISLDLTKSKPFSFRFGGPQMGERIYVLGYPSSVELGTNIKVTDGIVSSLNTKDLYQISSPVQPGNSGSPLLDMKGRVVGVVNAGIPSLDNVGFAINATDIQAFLRRLGASVATTGGFDKYPFEQLVNMTKGSVYYIKVDY